jgi:hypothetical protein
MYQKSRSLGRFIVPLLAFLISTGFLVCTATLSGAGSQSDTASAAKLQGNDGCWRATLVEQSTPTTNLRPDVVTISERDAWVVGGGPILRWDGIQWNNVLASPPGALYGVAAVSSTDIWAVGYQNVGGNPRPLTMHWDGAQWSVIPSPAPAPRSDLTSVTAISANDVWATGTIYTSYTTTFTMHWDGTDWSIVPSPNPGTWSNTLDSVSASGPNDVWAVGTYSLDEERRGKGLIMHWDGSAWSLIPGLPSYVTNFRGVDALAPDNVWIVGYSADIGEEIGGIVALKWDGAQLNVIPVPDLYGVLEGVSAVSSTSIWTSGWYYNVGRGHNEMLSLHCDGVECRAVPGVHPEGATYNHVLSISAESDDNIWAVGSRESPTYVIRRMIVRYNPDDSCPEGLPPTVTPVTATPTAIPTTTPTACALQFYDVPPSHTFYPYVRCLACKGIIGGYNDNSFRPNNLLTRDQIAKMVANSAGFNEPPGTQIFEDIPPSHPFYDYIQRLVNRGIMTGYPCGGAGEPCVQPYNRPYFRVGTFTTRGQISKIVAQAKGYTDPVQGQRFEDVPPSNTFYLYIERLAARGIMGGYPCGTLPNEPCGTTNRPYFRWGNNATRGQTTKITSNTFFPGCGASSGR